MQEIDVHDYARQLLEARSERAVAEAAQKALAYEKQGEREQADTWRHIEAALKVMRGPHESLTSSRRRAGLWDQELHGDYCSCQ